MTTSTRPRETPRAASLPDVLVHRHTTRCWWDLDRNRWRCSPERVRAAGRDLAARGDEGC